MKRRRQNLLMATKAFCIIILICTFCVGCGKLPKVVTSSEEGITEGSSSTSSHDSVSLTESASPNTESTENVLSSSSVSGGNSSETEKEDKEQELTNEEFESIISDGGGQISVGINTSSDTVTSVNKPTTDNPPTTEETSSETLESDESEPQESGSSSTESIPKWDKDGDGYYDIEVH